MAYYSVSIKDVMECSFKVEAPDKATAEKLVDYLLLNDTEINDLKSFECTDREVRLYQSKYLPAYGESFYTFEDYRDKVYPNTGLNLCPTQKVDSCSNCKYGVPVYYLDTPFIFCNQDNPNNYSTTEERERLYDSVFNDLLNEKDYEWLGISDRDEPVESPRARCFCHPEKCEKFEAIK